MKLFKNIFGNKPNEISKYEPNTLAEINESPDTRKVQEENETQKKPTLTTSPTGKNTKATHTAP